MEQVKVRVIQSREPKGVKPKTPRAETSTPPLGQPKDSHPLALFPNSIT